MTATDSGESSGKPRPPEGDWLGTPYLRLERKGSIALVTVDRPQARNAMTGAMYFAVRYAVDHVNSDPELAGLVITGIDDVFIPGGDLGADPVDDWGGPGYLGMDCAPFDAVRYSRKPVIAAINGICQGGGLMIAMMADVSVASERATFRAPELYRGIADMNYAQVLPIQIGPGRAKDMLLTGRKVTAAEAEAWGLVSRVVPHEELLTAAFEALSGAARCAPQARAEVKRVISQSYGMYDRMSMDESLAGPEALEGFTAFKERRQPAWVPEDLRAEGRLWTGDIPATIPAAIERAAQLWPEDEALVDTLPDGSTNRLNFLQLRDRMWQVAAALVASGVQPGDRVAVWAPNSSTWIAAGYGAYVAGAVLVPLNSRFKGHEAAHVLKTSRARLLFTVTDFLDTDYVELLTDQPGLDDLKEIVVISGPNRSDTTSWADFLERAEGVAAADVDARAAAVRPGDPSDIIFTSGTTGAPKGAVLTHGASTRVYTTWSSGVGLQHGDRYLMIYPFFHTAGLKSCVLACILTGAVMVPHPVFDVPSVLARVQEEHITMLPGPPAIYQAILNTDRSAYDLSSLRLAVTGAAAIPVSLVVRLREELGFSSVVTAYGLTETTGTATMCQHDDDPETIATTSGRAIPDTELKVVDDEGRTLPAGEPGEVLVRGYNVMKEYFGDPEATAAAIDTDGWLKTGDIAVLDERGNIRITDRKKDMYIVGGFNAYPAEIESIISKHPAVASVAIVGVPDERMGEVGMAYVIPRQGDALDKNEFLAWCREQMANYKVPRYVEVVDALPLNPSGKVLKYELRARAAQSAR